MCDFSRNLPLQNVSNYFLLKHIRFRFFLVFIDTHVTALPTEKWKNRGSIADRDKSSSILRIA
jgi:hypothetical protein